MLDKIAPGARINVKVVKTPSRLAARKTLVRVLGKDAGAQTNDRRLTRLRRKHYNPQRRGGRLYGGHMIKFRSLTGDAGESATLTATLDVLRDLGSVSRFIEVKKA